MSALKQNTIRFISMMMKMDVKECYEIYRIVVLTKADKYRLVGEKLDIHEFEFWTNKQDKEFFERCHV
jgi:hypothetical protein